jgi:hypothetical protein
MKRKWKYDNRIVLRSIMNVLPVSIGIATVFFISSCNHKDEHKYITTAKPSELDG